MEELKDKHYLDLDERRIKGAALNRNLLMVVIGHDRNSTFLIYREVMKTLGSSPQIQKSFLYFGAVQPIDRQQWMDRNDVEGLPLLLVFYQQRLVAKIDRFAGKSQAAEFLLQIAFRSMIYSLEDESGVWYYDKLELGQEDPLQKTADDGSGASKPKLEGQSSLDEKQLREIFGTLNDLREHTIYFTQRMPIFEDTVNHRDPSFIQNQVNPFTYFDSEYQLNAVEKTIFFSLISLIEDDFNYVYMPSNEVVPKEHSVESPEDPALLYIHSRRYNVTHALTSPGNGSDFLATLRDVSLPIPGEASLQMEKDRPF